MIVLQLIKFRFRYVIFILDVVLYGVDALFDLTVNLLFGLVITKF